MPREFGSQPTSYETRKVRLPSTTWEKIDDLANDEEKLSADVIEDAVNVYDNTEPTNFAQEVTRSGRTSKDNIERR